MDSKTGTHACCGQVAKETVAPPAVIKRQVAPIPKIMAKPVPFSARAAQSRGYGKPPHRGEFSGPVALFFRLKEAAIASANDSDFDLSRLVLTKNTRASIIQIWRIGQRDGVCQDIQNPMK